MATFYFCGFKREKSPAIFLLTINTFIMQLGIISRIYKAWSVDVLEYFDIELFLLLETGRTISTQIVQFVNNPTG